MSQHNDQEVIKEGKIFALVAYWPFLCILPLMLKKENRFAVYHGKQGLVLFIFLVGGFLLQVIPFFGQIFYRLVVFCYFLVMLWGSIQALNGNYTRIPLISRLAAKIIL